MSTEIRTAGKGAKSLFEPQEFGHLFVQESFARAVGLDPFAVDDELGNGALAGATDNFLGGARSGLDVDLLVRNVVPVQEALGFAAIRTPKGGINDQLHARVLMQDGDHWHT